MTKGWFDPPLRRRRDRPVPGATLAGAPGRAYCGPRSPRPMSGSPTSPHRASPAELKERLQAERRGEPFIVYRDGADVQRIVALGDARSLAIGSGTEADISLRWDDEVSALHAELHRVAGQWLVVDDGLSLNGTYLNDERVIGRRRLLDGDDLRFGRTVLVFREPNQRRRITAVGVGAERSVELSPAQQRVLVALCRPFADGSPFARPASNREIAEALSLSVAAVKTHLRALFERFGIEALPQNRKRAELVRLGLESGAVSTRELKQGA
jgi:pSer/pThr/pTyr-binding forkhead associated (FHA) protein